MKLTRFLTWLAVGVLSSTWGCRLPDSPNESIPRHQAGLSFIHPVQMPTPSTLERCQELPPAQKEHVYIFAANGFDPLCLGNLNGFCHAVRSLGFENVYFGQIWQPRSIEKKIVSIRESDPQARIILLGYSLGANEVRDMCQSLKTKNVPIDLLVYLGGDGIRNEPESRPENAGRILNITGHGFVLYGGDLFLKGADIDGAKNVRLDERHILLPSRAEVLDIFLAELLEVVAPVK